MKKIFLITVLSIVAIISVSCQDKAKNYSYYSSSQFPTTDTTVKYSDGRTSVLYHHQIFLDSMVQFDDLRQGFDGMEIRIALGSKSKIEQVITLINLKDKWTAKFYQITFGYNDIEDSIISFKKDSASLNPKNGWDYFLQKVFDLGITILPDQNTLKSYPEYSDGDHIIVQIATKNAYRIYSYSNIVETQNIVPQAKKMENIMELIEQEFNFKRHLNTKNEGKVIIKDVEIAPVKEPEHK